MSPEVPFTTVAEQAVLTPPSPEDTKLFAKVLRRPRRAEHSVLFDSPGPKTKRVIAIANVAGLLLVALGIYAIGSKLAEPSLIAKNGQLDWELWEINFRADTWTEFYLPGLWNTIKAAVVAILGAVVFGLLFGVGRLAQLKPVRWFSDVVVEFFRAVPVLLMMIFLWTFLGKMQFPEPSFWAVVIALTVYNGSVVAELVRAGVQNLPNGQHEAADAIGLTRVQALVNVLVPQALLAMLPAIIAQLVVALKDSALGVAISYFDLLRAAQVRGTPYNALQTLTVAAVIFIVINYLLGRSGEWLAGRMKGRTSRLDDKFAQEIPINVSALSASVMLEPVDQDGYNEQNLRAEPGWLDDDMFDSKT
jgi:glutamate transport system permease protein